MQEPRKPLFTQPVEEEAPRGRRARGRERRHRRLHLFSVTRNVFALIGLAFVIAELLRYVIIPYVLVPLNGMAGG